MASVIVVHGIGKQYLGPHTLHNSIASAVVDGIRIAGGTVTLNPDDVDVAFYGDYSRAPGSKGEAYLDSADINDSFEVELLTTWWDGAAHAEPDRVPAPRTTGHKIPTPITVQRALDALSRSRYFTGIADQLLLGQLRQVRRYLKEPETRRAVQQRVNDLVSDDTKVMIGHSLGSVVAYESLCANPGWQVQTFVTLGSPIGIRNLIFDRLIPAPLDSSGAWPHAIRSWTNVCDKYDVVALVKELAPLFPHPNFKITDRPVNNGWRAHELIRHLTAAETGGAVVKGLMSDYEK